MRNLVTRLWRDEAGFVVSTELVLIATIVVIGLVTGLTAVRDAVVEELADVAAAVGEVNQSYSFGAITGHCSSTSGSLFDDLVDFCEIADANNDVANSGGGPGAQCVNICTVPAEFE